jgi:hypothetical protein
MSDTQVSAINVLCVDKDSKNKGQEVEWSIEKILLYINADRSEEWDDYDMLDWIEGWKEWIEGDGIWSIPSLST